MAATRARDVLVVPAVADEPQKNGWVGPLLPSLYPEERTSRLSIVAPGCPRFPGDDTILERPPRAALRSGIRPGLHKPERGRHEVVWWDPSLFENPLTTKPGLRRHTLLQATEGDEPGEGGREYERWLERRARVLEEGSAPTYRVATVTRIVETEKPRVEGASGVRVAEVEGRDLLRPGGKRFGALVHEILARAPLGANSSDVEALAESLGRILGNPEEERKAATEAVTGALAHPLLEKAWTAAVVFRETPLVYREPAGRLVEGVPDLVFRHQDSEWTLVRLQDRFPPAWTSRRTPTEVRSLFTGSPLVEATGIRAEGWLLYI